MVDGVSSLYGAGMASFDIWAIYDHPTDYPDAFVVRPWRLKPGPDGGWHEPGYAYPAGSLTEARAHLPSGLTKLPRLPYDDPAILEVWV